MIARLDEIGKDLKEVKRENASLLKALLEANSNAEKVVLEYKLRDKEYRKLEKKHNALVERLSLMNTQTYASSKSLKGIDRKRVVKGKHDDKDDLTVLLLLYQARSHSRTLPHHATRRILRRLPFPRKDHTGKE